MPIDAPIVATIERNLDFIRAPIDFICAPIVAPIDLIRAPTMCL